jgi:hypothetical protein
MELGCWRWHRWHRRISWFGPEPPRVRGHVLGKGGNRFERQRLYVPCCWRPWQLLGAEWYDWHHGSRQQLAVVVFG